MPIYEYACRKCGAHSEALQGINDPPLTECSECGGELRKRVSAPSFQFKGTGWYVTDYARKDGDRGGESSKSSAGTDSSESTKSDTSKSDTSKSQTSTSEKAAKPSSQEKSA
jgi:putative FmdB family regulatory protein